MCTLRHMQVCVLGAGSWGTALTLVLSRNGHEVVLAGRDEEAISALRSLRENLKYLPGFAIPDTVRAVEFHESMGSCDLWVVAVPSSAVRDVIHVLPSNGADVVLAAKGLESGSAKTMSQVAREVAPETRVTALSGPNLAIELARGVPTVAVAASENAELAERVRQAFMCRNFRVYVSHDVMGVELAGSLKNVLAIGAGISDGLGFGDNTKGAVLARGLGEMARLGLAMGAQLETFLGIAGVGDLFATANSRLSRNYRVGLALGQGKALKEALDAIGQVAEGVPTSEGALILARRYDVSMPVCEAIDAVIHSRLDPRSAVDLLMERTPKCEGILGDRVSG